MANLYVSTAYNSSTEGWGTTHFNSYQAAYNYAIANAKYSTIYIEKSSSISGFCFDNNHKNYTGLNVVIQDGAIMGNASSKWDMTYDVTVKAGGTLVSGRPGSASYGDSHIKNDWIIGEEGAEKKATVNYLNHSTYKTECVTVLYNGRLNVNNAIFKVGDFGAVGSVYFKDSEVTVGGSIGFGVYQQGATKTMINTTMTVKGHNLNGNTTYYGVGRNLIAHLSMDNSSIIVDDGVEGTAADTVELAMDFSKFVKKTLTLTNGSFIRVEKDTQVIVKEKVTLENSRLEVGALTIDTDKVLSMDWDSTVQFTSITNNGVIQLTGEMEGDKLYKLFDYVGEGTMTADDYKAILGDAFTADFAVIDNDLCASKLLGGDIYINSDWAGKYENGQEIAEGKVFGVNAFASFNDADAFTAGSRTFHYAMTSDINAKVTIDCESVSGNGSVTITGAGDVINGALTEGSTFSEEVNLKAEDNKGELVFTVEGDSDYSINVNITESNDPEKPVVVGEIAAGSTASLADNNTVSQHLNAAAYTFTVGANELCEYALTLTNNTDTTVYIEITDALGNRVFNTSSAMDIQRAIPTLAAGDYTIKVDVPHSLNGIYEAQYDLYLDKTDLLDDGNGGSSAAYIKDADDTRDGANTAATAISDWVGKMDSTDWYKLDMSGFASGDSFKATLEANGAGVRATVVKVKGGVETTVSNLYTSSISNRTLAYDDSYDYYVKFTNSSSNSAKSVYSMTIASA